jgi:cytochrome P450
VALSMPLNVILSILGLPESDYPRMLKLTQEIFAGGDDELQRDDADLMGVLLEFFEYFSALTTARKADPTDDLASLIANAEVDGEPLGVMEQLSYYVIVASAGHDTTTSSIAGGLLALLEHPAELARLRTDPTLAATATEEVIRWVSPVKHFLRNAVASVTVGGHEFAPGDVAMLSYWSANFDAAVFADPFRFDVGRHPNRHLAFGFGAHYCLGAVLARMQVKALLTALVPVLESLELAGEPEHSASYFVSGLKHLPIRYRLTV